jgi:hypothetical protein
MRHFASLTKNQRQLRSISLLIVVVTIALVLSTIGFGLMAADTDSIEFHWFRFFLLHTGLLITSLAQILVFESPTAFASSSSVVGDVAGGSGSRSQQQTTSLPRNASIQSHALQSDEARSPQATESKD